MRKTLIAAITGVAALAALGGQAAEQPQTAKPVPVDFVYDLFLGGIKAGELTMTARYQGDRYTAKSVMRTAGIVGRVYKAAFTAETEGRLTEAGMVPNRFAADSRMKKKRQALEMVYNGAVPSTITAQPEFIPKPWQIEPSAQTGTLDPISAALSALAPTPIDQVCNKTVEVFDGRKRYAVDLGAPVKEGERTRCPAKYRRVAGFKPKMLRKPDFPFNIWFVERGDGLAHVLRAAGESPFGLAVALMRQR